MVTTNLPPSDFVEELTSPGLSLDSGENVSLAQYLCSNPAMGGNAAADHLAQTLAGLARRKGVSLRARCDNDPYVGRVFTGQGRPSSILTIMNLMIEWQADLRDIPVGQANPRHPRRYGWYFDQVAPFQTMVTDKLFGFDCIGFVSRYLCRIGYFTDYREWPPTAYLNTFHPIGSADQATPLSLLVWENGLHIAAIDAIDGIETNRGQPEITATICQSSSRQSVRGPQTNCRVVLRSTGRRGSYAMWGQSGSGMIFRVHAEGTPPMPVQGHVYIGKARDIVYEAPAGYGGGSSETAVA